MTNPITPDFYSATDLLYQFQRLQTLLQSDQEGEMLRQFLSHPKAAKILEKISCSKMGLNLVNQILSKKSEASAPNHCALPMIFQFFASFDDPARAMLFMERIDLQAQENILSEVLKLAPQTIYTLAQNHVNAFTSMLQFALSPQHIALLSRDLFIAGFLQEQTDLTRHAPLKNTIARAYLIQDIIKTATPGDQARIIEASGARGALETALKQAPSPDLI